MAAAKNTAYRRSPLGQASDVSARPSGDNSSDASKNADVSTSARSRDSDATAAKVAEYERFVEERLKVDLQQAMEDRHKVQEEIQVYEELVRNIEALEANGVEEMRAMVNLGGEVFVQADVPDTSRIFVSVGLGFHVEFTRLEAKEFAATKIEHLRKHVAGHTETVSSIKAHIKLVVEGIRELLNISAEEV
ncbi:hypothetical protein CLOM_g10964 [Closterium sp. NIES-68]|nr:hypothetical protein CLOM_g10964 [Closterium sp. NIES-68]GJP86006.1 hypothetical protein CLOP_g16076 [Closterium sp. NIES-67]